MSCRRKASFPESHCKGSDDLVSLGSCKGVKENVVAESDASKVLGETVPPWFLCVFPVTALAREVSAAMQSATS